MKSTLRRTPNVMKRLLIVSVIALTLAQTAGTSYSTGSMTSASDTTEVVLSVAEADSIINLIDDQELRIRLLRIELDRLRGHARNDSLFNVRMLLLQENSYEQIIAVYKADREHWFVRTLKHPAIWFCVGAYAGLQAAAR